MPRAKRNRILHGLDVFAQILERREAVNVNVRIDDHLANRPCARTLGAGDRRFFTPYLHELRSANSAMRILRIGTRPTCGVACRARERGGPSPSSERALPVHPCGSIPR